LITRIPNSGNNIAIHKTAVIETGVTLKPPMIIEKNCFVGANSYLRNGVFLMDNVRIRTGCEIKTSIICSGSAIAHFNFIGDSMIGGRVNFEAGSITANHYNEREDKTITVVHNSGNSGWYGRQAEVIRACILLMHGYRKIVCVSDKKSGRQKQ
jgi:bifunctional N-acetylglucosamine-1-phosphate-uridyltransferase/glucosamine-1-phosphate-acetyltransferase GlmU-like protein